MTAVERTQLERMIKRMPRFMHPEFERIENLEDLEYQVSVEIVIGEGGSTDPRWTAAQIHRAKMYAAEVHIKALQSKGGAA